LQVIPSPTGRGWREAPGEGRRAPPTQFLSFQLSKMVMGDAAVSPRRAHRQKPLAVSRNGVLVFSAGDSVADDPAAKERDRRTRLKRIAASRHFDGRFPRREGLAPKAREAAWPEMTDTLFASPCLLILVRTNFLTDYRCDIRKDISGQMPHDSKTLLTFFVLAAICVKCNTQKFYFGRLNEN